jgi:cell envelope opacity-associated protein A
MDFTHAKFELPYQLTDAEVVADDNLSFDEVLEKSKAIYDEFKKTNTFAPSDWRATQLARELCRAQGHDPDMMVVDVNHAQRGPFGSVSASSVVPAWTLYLTMAYEMSGALWNGSPSSSPSSAASS